MPETGNEYGASLSGQSWNGRREIAACKIGAIRAGKVTFHEGKETRNRPFKCVGVFDSIVWFVYWALSFLY